MKKIASALCAVVLAMSMAACSTGDEKTAPPEETVTVTATPEPQETVTETPTPLPQSEDEAFLMVVDENYPAFYNANSEADLIDFAQSTCGAFDRGASVEEVLGVVSESSNDPEIQEAMAFTMGAGVGIYCPEYVDLIEDFTGSNT